MRPYLIVDGDGLRRWLDLDLIQSITEPSVTGPGGSIELYVFCSFRDAAFTFAWHVYPTNSQFGDYRVGPMVFPNVEQAVDYVKGTYFSPLFEAWRNGRL